MGSPIAAAIAADGVMDETAARIEEDWEELLERYELWELKLCCCCGERPMAARKPGN